MNTKSSSIRRHGGLRGVLSGALALLVGKRSSGRAGTHRPAAILAVTLTLAAAAPLKSEAAGSGWSDTFGNPGADGTVRAIIEFDHDNKPRTPPVIVAGGSFTTIGSNGQIPIPTPFPVAYWDGSTWTPLGVFIDPLGGGDVHALAVYGNQLYAAGHFHGSDVVCRPTPCVFAQQYTLLKLSGAVWTPVSPNFGPVSPSPVGRALAVYNGALYVGGDFAYEDPSAGIIKHIARWDDTSWSRVAGGVDGNVTGERGVHALRTYGDVLAVGGIFRSALNERRGAVRGTYGIAAWTGRAWASLGGGVLPCTPQCDDRGVFALEVFQRELYVGGNFGRVAGLPRPVNAIARWNGKRKAWNYVGGGCDGKVFALSASGDRLYAGGDFSCAGIGPARNTARWNGERWFRLRGGLDSTVLALHWGPTVAKPGLYAGGLFDYASNGYDASVPSPLPFAPRFSSVHIALWQHDTCPADVTGNGVVDVDDSTTIILNWGTCPGCPAPLLELGRCYADINGSGTVDVDDHTAVILNWGPCH